MCLCLLMLAGLAAGAVGPAQPTTRPAPPAFAAAVSYLDTPDIVLGVETDQRGAGLKVRLWVATPAEPAWRPIECISRFERAVGWHAPADGEYSFYLVVENSAGRSAADPAGDFPPHARVVVDTTAPTLQLHRAVPQRAEDGRVRLRLDLTVFDENLGAQGVRLFTRPAGGSDWSDAGAIAVVNGRHDWAPPPDCPADLDVRVIATDLAGNQSRDGLLRVSTQVAPSLSPPPADSQPFADASETASSAPADPPAPSAEVARSVEYLRRQAERELAADRPSLATHRLRDAVMLAPGDARLRRELARVLLQSGRFEEADQQFQSVLSLEPDDLDALEGLALTAAAQRRYPVAAEHLRSLLDRSPDTGRLWLRFGDIQHKLGRSRAARDAWDRVLALEPPDSRLRAQARERLGLLDQRSPTSQPVVDHGP